MTKFATETNQFYEIREIQAFRNAKALKLEKCTEKIQQTKFNIHEVNYIDLSNWGPWIVEKQQLVFATENLLTSIKKLIEYQTYIPLIL